MRSAVVGRRSGGLDGGGGRGGGGEASEGRAWSLRRIASQSTSRCIACEGDNQVTPLRNAGDGMITRRPRACIAGEEIPETATCDALPTRGNA
jgi:hypothetical protein